MEENKTRFVDKYYKIILILIFLTGILIRLYKYLQNASLWGDEAALAINVVNGSYRDLFSGLQLMQACPPGFTVLVKFLLNSFHPANLYIRDLVLRFIPLTCGVSAIFAFYYLVKLVFEENKFKILTAVLLFTLTPAAIIYSSQFKQYSMELLISIILLTIFYKIIILEKNKWYYQFFIALSVWFSYSAFLVIASGCLTLILKNRKIFVTTFISVFISSIVYYFISLKDIFSVNYTNLNIYWSQAYSFLQFSHPTRIFYRLGELFVLTRPVSLFIGLIIFIAIVVYIFNKKNLLYKQVLFLTPFFLTVAASMLHKYPFCCRLILFLIPVFLIFITDLEGKPGKVLKGLLLLACLISIPVYSPDARALYYSYARDVIAYLKLNQEKNDIYIFDNTSQEYLFYINGAHLTNLRNIVIPVTCYTEVLKPCSDVLKKLPKGKYYLLTSSYYAREIAEEAGLKPIELDLGFKPKKCKAVYFEKN